MMHHPFRERKKGVYQRLIFSFDHASNTNDRTLAKDVRELIAECGSALKLKRRNRQIKAQFACDLNVRTARGQESLSMQN